MKKLILVSGFLIGIFLTSSSFAYTIQRNVRVGAAPISGDTVLSRYGGHVMQNGYNIGIEKQNYYATTIYQYSNEQTPKYDEEVDFPVKTLNTLVDLKEDDEGKTTTLGLMRRTSHRLSQFSTREARIQNGWDRLFE